MASEPAYGQFWRVGDRVAVRLGLFERQLLDDLARQVSELLTPERDEPLDPLAELVGITPDAERPDDPALRRLLPDAYLDDRDASAQFRRFTEGDLRTRKLGDAAVVRAALAAVADVDDVVELVIDDVQARQWLGVLNDVRLALGSRLAVSEEPIELDEDDPRWPHYAVYGWLTQVQETLVESLVPRHP